MKNFALKLHNDPNIYHVTEEKIKSVINLLNEAIKDQNGAVIFLDFTSKLKFNEKNLETLLKIL